MLSVRLHCSLLTMVCATVGSVVCQVALLPLNNGLCDSGQYCLSGHVAPFEQWYAQQWAVLSVRSRCSLPTLVVCTIVSQIALLLSYTGNLHCCKSGHSAPFLQ